jgi:hypothetical protein
MITTLKKKKKKLLKERKCMLLLKREISLMDRGRGSDIFLLEQDIF